MKFKYLLGALALVASGAAVGVGNLAQATDNGIPAFQAKVGSSTTQEPVAQAVREVASAPGPRTLTASATATYYSPAGCKGSTNYPHLSGTDASVHGTMICRYAVEQVATATELTRDRWFGYETLGTDFSKRDWSTWSGNATPHVSCLGEGWYRYRGWSTHKSLESGMVYASDTWNWQFPGVSEFTC